MKILNWMQSKLNGRHTSKRSPTSLGSSSRYSMEEARKEEFSDWPHGLLAIGTFGNNQIKGDNPEKNESTYASHSPHYLSDFTPEEVGKLQKELTILLKLKPTSEGDDSGFEKANLQLDKFINCPSCLDDGRTNCNKLCDKSDDSGGDLSRSTSVVKSKGKEVLQDHNNNVIRQRSMSFLLKKLFACHGGFAPAPSLRDPIPESRMEKLLRAILHKKIYPQTSPTSGKKYLGERYSPRTDSASHQSDQDKENDGCKWVKTDSEYIVLEI
ncbi:protein DEEPER ROOTING 1-like [Aristolochia californica]|uniref:protein DEEPER ROOTING 1-like n=1 Tax=Aristolochia californica TaxID=171875 RepID=UPI0035E14F71